MVWPTFVAWNDQYQAIIVCRPLSVHYMQRQLISKFCCMQLGLHSKRPCIANVFRLKPLSSVLILGKKQQQKRKEREKNMCFPIF